MTITRRSIERRNTVNLNLSDRCRWLFGEGIESNKNREQRRDEARRLRT